MDANVTVLAIFKSSSDLYIPGAGTAVFGLIMIALAYAHWIWTLGSLEWYDAVLAQMEEAQMEAAEKEAHLQDATLSHVVVDAPPRTVTLSRPETINNSILTAKEAENTSTIPTPEKESGLIMSELSKNDLHATIQNSLESIEQSLTAEKK